MARSVTRRGFAARVGGAGLLLVTLAGCGRDKKTAQPVPPGSTVLALGDSLTFGTGASAETSYPTVLAGLTGWNVVNAGVSGDTSAQALARLPALLAEHQPKLVIVSIGGNDFLRKLPESDTRTHVHAICKQSLAAGAQVLLVAVPRATVAAALGQMTDHALYAEVAKDLKIPLQREAWGEVLAQPDLRADAVHANARGYAQFARSVQSTAAAVGLLPR
ncbi:MAG TPA: GDSL-type esterase/lipase family protein [Ottowia sp.]|nr:GDSL-type esterase/lipase family protein [Ottowia sp.]